MTKADARSQFRARRQALTDADWQQRCRQLAALTISQLGESPGVVHTFLPIIRQREVDTWPVIRHIWRSGATGRVVVPRTDFLTKSLIHCWLLPDTILTENRLGIPEPASDTAPSVAPQQLDVVLVPLLAFDKQGQRVGYGGGFYDRFLSDCRADCLKIGLSLFDPVAQIDDVWPGDIRLNQVVTPTQIHLF